MQPDNTQKTPQNAPYSGTGGEKVIQPADPSLQSAAPNIVQPSNPAPAPAPSYNPAEPEHKVPTLDLKQTVNKIPEKLALQHKSLMGLAILGIISTAALAYYGIQLNSAITQAIRESKDIGYAQTFLYILWATVVVSFAMNVYFLLAKNRDTVALFLKIILVLELLGLLSEATGVGDHDPLSFVLTGGYVIYVFVVLSVIRTPRAM